MTDFAGGQVNFGATPTAQTTAKGIELYANDGHTSTKGIIQLTVRYHFWSYAVCQRPRYFVAGHFEWGYTSRLDTLKEPHIKTEQEKIQWIPDK